tara:strand:- start:409 stop:657 length:249 start_codon:yes stop_codon:yes gene_type:complete
VRETGTLKTEIMIRERHVKYSDAFIKGVNDRKAARQLKAKEALKLRGLLDLARAETTTEPSERKFIDEMTKFYVEEITRLER